MTKRGYKVNVFERRKDLRSEIITVENLLIYYLQEDGRLKKGVESEVKKINTGL